MRCYICDTYIEDPKIDPRDGKVMPCNDCLSEIDEALSDFDGEDLMVDWGFMLDDND